MATPATLIYNGNAGRSGRVDIDELQEQLREAGFEPVYRATRDEDELAPILAEAEGVVVAVGGDGTLRAVASHLVDTDVALAVVPLGTANNVARSLGVEGSPQEIVAGLARPRRVPFDLGRVRHPWGADYFLEAAGCGIFADILYRYDPDRGKSVLRAIGTLREVLSDYRARDMRVTLDGEDLSGSYLGLEVLNTSATGPRLKLAPGADPCDGLLDVVRIAPPEGVPMLAYAGRLLTEAFDELPNVEVHRGRRLEVVWDGDPIHVDALLRPSRAQVEEDRNGDLEALRPSVRGTTDRIEVEILAGALELWLPAAPEEDAEHEEDEVEDREPEAAEAD